jgi:hypothetical protein
MNAIFGGSSNERLRRENWMANVSKDCSPYGPRNRWIPGAILIAIGTVILLDHLGIIHGEYFWRFWPAILIGVGLVKLLSEGNRLPGMILTLVGAFFLLQNLGYRLFSWGTLWPFIIIAVGVSMIWGRFDRPRFPFAQGSGQGQQGQGQTRGSGQSDPDVVEAFALFGGVERRVHTNSLKGGQITAMFGGVELDFRLSDMEGDEIALYVDAVFGGIEISVPDRWTVVWEGLSVFGGYSDETRAPLPDVSGAAPRKRLILRGRAMFGGIEVKN